VLGINNSCNPLSDERSCCYQHNTRLYSEAMNINPQNPRWEDRDWLVVSNGHSGPALYATLALKGYFPLEELLTLNQGGTNLPSHCDRNKTGGIDMTTGSLGQGVSSRLCLCCKANGSTCSTCRVLSAFTSIDP
jgi:transketolase N-terminal domain/subunit